MAAEKLQIHERVTDGKINGGERDMDLASARAAAADAIKIVLQTTPPEKLLGLFIGRMEAKSLELEANSNKQTVFVLPFPELFVEVLKGVGSVNDLPTLRILAEQLKKAKGLYERTYGEDDRGKYAQLMKLVWARIASLEEQSLKSAGTKKGQSRVSVASYELPPKLQPIPAASFPEISDETLPDPVPGALVQNLALEASGAGKPKPVAAEEASFLAKLKKVFGV